MYKALVIIGLAIGLAGCGIAAQQRQAAAGQQYTADYAACAGASSIPATDSNGNSIQAHEVLLGGASCTKRQ